MKRLRKMATKYEVVKKEIVYGGFEELKDSSSITFNGDYLYKNDEEFMESNFYKNNEIVIPSGSKIEDIVDYGNVVEYTFRNSSDTLTIDLQLSNSEKEEYFE